VLGEHTRARLAELGRSRVELAVEAGHFRAAIRPRSGYRWSFPIGPYRVEVEGTRFDVTWLPEQHHFQGDVERGRVRVRGGALDSGA
jgi:hypothetical protein